MKLNCFSFEVKDGVAIATISRPEARNALNQDAWQDIEQIVNRLNEDQDIHVAVFTGAGEKAFIAGADIRALQQRSMIETLNGRSPKILKDLENCEKITIAAINGFSLGGGCELTLACDIRIACENAKLGLPELNLGVIPGGGGTQRLARLVGLGRAKELILTGKIIDAQEALNIGLVSRVVPLENLLDEALKIAGEIMKKGPLSLNLAKKLINASLSTDQNTGLMLELFAQSILFSSSDRMEGINAFFEKRKPEFTGS